MLQKNMNFIPTGIIQLQYALWKNVPPSFFPLWIMARCYTRHDTLCQRRHILASTAVSQLLLKRYSQLARMCITYHFIANFHINTLFNQI